MDKVYFNPGCALSIYKPDMEIKMLKFLNEHYGPVALHNICCRHDPGLAQGSLIVNVCAGCDKRFSTLYEGISTISLWEVLDGLDAFPLPNYQGLNVSVQDACPVKEKPQVHKAVRSLLSKMNIEIVETEYHGVNLKCCGDIYYPKYSVEEVNRRMKQRADSMPCDDVCVYCVSCIKAMHIGGKKPRYLMDLLFGEQTEPQVYDTVKWHGQLQDYIDKH